MNDPNRYKVTTDPQTTDAIIAMGYQGTVMKVIAGFLAAISPAVPAMVLPPALIPILGIWFVDGHLLRSERKLRGRVPETGWLGASFSQTLTIYYTSLGSYVLLLGL